MFISFVVVCLILVANSQVNCDQQQEATNEYNKLKKNVESKVETFDKNSKQWQNEVFNLVPKFDKDTKELLSKEYAKVTGLVEELRAKNAKCANDQKKALADLENSGNSFYTCSSQIHASTERNMGELQKQVEIAKGRLSAYEERLKGCAKTDACLKPLIADIKKSDLVKVVEGYTNSAKDLADSKKKQLPGCSTLEEFKKNGEEIVKKVKACIG